MKTQGSTPLTSSPDRLERINYAISEERVRCKDKTTRSLRLLAYRQYWRDRNNEALVSELASDLAKSLMHIIESNQARFKLGTLIMGLADGAQQTPDQTTLTAAQNTVLKYEGRFGWARIEDIFEPDDTDSSSFTHGEEEAEETGFEGFSEATMNEFMERLPTYDEAALREFGIAVGLLSFAEDRGAGEGSHPVVATIAYLEAFEPARDRYQPAFA